MSTRSGMRKKDLPSSNLMDRVNGSKRPARYKKSGNKNSLTAKVVVITLGLVLSLGGVSAAVAILVRGNSSSTDGVVSLGVGQATANTCDTTTINTDTTSRWFDANETFMIEKVELWGVDTECAGKTLTLVMNYSPLADQSYTCILPTTSLITGNYNLATFAFATTAISTTSTYYLCASNLTLTTTSNLAGTAVQIL